MWLLSAPNYYLKRGSERVGIELKFIRSEGKCQVNNKKLFNTKNVNEKKTVNQDKINKFKNKNDLMFERILR